MIKTPATFKGTWAIFGFGTLSLTPNVPNANRGTLDIQTCDKSEIGKDLPKGAKLKGPKIRLSFNNTESIDALMTKLQDIKELMLEGKENGQADKKGTDSGSETGTEETVL